jgi:hypothetical protein
VSLQFLRKTLIPTQKVHKNQMFWYGIPNGIHKNQMFWYGIPNWFTFGHKHKVTLVSFLSPHIQAEYAAPRWSFNSIELAMCLRHDPN